MVFIQLLRPPECSAKLVSSSWELKTVQRDFSAHSLKAIRKDQYFWKSVFVLPITTQTATNLTISLMLLAQCKQIEIHKETNKYIKPFSATCPTDKSQGSRAWFGCCGSVSHHKLWPWTIRTNTCTPQQPLTCLRVFKDKKNAWIYSCRHLNLFIARWGSRKFHYQSRLWVPPQLFPHW